MTASRPHRTAAIVLSGLLLLLVGAECDSANTKHESPGGLAMVPMRLGNKTFTLEVADTDAAKQYGLMHRDSMPADHGMIFVFDADAPRSFWMKNTRIPLDIIYVTSAGKVDSIKQMKPHDLTGVPSDGAAQYAIELNKDAAASAGVKPGMTLELPRGLKAKD